MDRLPHFSTITSMPQKDWRSFLETVPEGLAYFEPKLPIDLSLPTEILIKLYYEMICMDCNAAYAKMHQQPRDKIIGMQVKQMLIKDRANFSFIKEALSQPGQQLQTLDLREVNPDGSKKCYQAHLLHEAQANHLIRVWVHRIDYTEQQEIREKLQQEESAYRTIFDNVSDDLFMVAVTSDHRFRYLAINPSGEKHLQLSMQEIVGQYVEDVLPKELAELFIDTFKYCIETGKPLIHEADVPFPSGTNKMSAYIVPLYNEEGKIDRIIGIARDITATYKIQATLESALAALANTVSERDPYTAGHQSRVAELAAAIARELNLDETHIRWLRLAANVHDIGKIKIPAAILNRPARLTPIEFELIKVHPETGYNILKNLEFPLPIADIVRQHHEYLDGSGYPYGLKGDAILFETKIITVADMVEAMSSHRPYRPALGVDYALNQIKELSGKKLLPEVVDACCKILTKDPLFFDKIKTP